MKNDLNNIKDEIAAGGQPGRTASEAQCCNGAREEFPEYTRFRLACRDLVDVMDTFASDAAERSRQLGVAHRLLKDVLSLAHLHVPPAGLTPNCTRLTTELAILAIQIQRETGLSVYQSKP